jgi:hypothetical protein
MTTHDTGDILDAARGIYIAAYRAFDSSDKDPADRHIYDEARRAFWIKCNIALSRSLPFPG